jgi:hypothetical protein
VYASHRVFVFTPPPVLAPANISPTVSCYRRSCGQYTNGRSRARPMAARQTPQTYPKFPYSVGTPSRENLWQVFHHPLHPKWSRSRVSLGDSTKPAQVWPEPARWCNLVGLSPISVVHFWCNYRVKSARYAEAGKL